MSHPTSYQPMLNSRKLVVGHTANGIELDGKIHDGMIYWLQSENILGLWIFNSLMFKTKVDKSTRMAFLGNYSDSIADQKFEDSILNGHITVGSVNQESATLKYESQELKLGVVQGVQDVTGSQHDFIMALIQKVEGHEKDIKTGPTFLQQQNNENICKPQQSKGNGYKSNYNRFG